MATNSKLLALVALLAGSDIVFASTKQEVFCQNSQNCSPTATKTTFKTTINNAKRDVDPFLHEQMKREVEAMDTMTALFRRDPDYEFAMAIIARNAEAADAATQQIVQQIHSGTVDKAIVKAAKAKGLITGNGPAAKNLKKRDIEAREKKAASAGGKPGLPPPAGGNSHSPNEIAQHIMSGGHIPPEITAALKASPHYETPSQAQKKAGGAQGGKAAGAPGSATPASKGAAAKGSAKFRRDASFFDFDYNDLFSRGEKNKVHFKDVKKLFENAQKDDKAKEEIIKDLNSDKEVQKEAKKLAAKYSEGEDDGEEVTMDDLSAMMSAAGEDKKAKKTVMKFFNNEKVEKVTSKLVEKYNKKSKRDADAEFEDLVAREAELFDLDDDLFARDAEAEFEYDSDLFVREADPDTFYVSDLYSYAY